MGYIVAEKNKLKERNRERERKNFTSKMNHVFIKYQKFQYSEIISLKSIRGLIFYKGSIQNYKVKLIITKYK